MLKLEDLSEHERLLLAESCEDFLLHRNIPLRSYLVVDIIDQALKEGYQLSKFTLRRRHVPNQRTIS